MRVAAAPDAWLQVSAGAATFLAAPSGFPLGAVADPCSSAAAVGIDSHTPRLPYGHRGSVRGDSGADASLRLRKQLRRAVGGERLQGTQGSAPKIDPMRSQQNTERGSHTYLGGRRGRSELGEARWRALLGPELELGFLSCRLVSCRHLCLSRFCQPTPLDFFILFFLCCLHLGRDQTCQFLAAGAEPRARRTALGPAAAARSSALQSLTVAKQYHSKSASWPAAGSRARIIRVAFEL